MFPASENTGNVPAFLLKLWTLVEDKSCDELICWDSTGKSFHVTDQARFAKEVLPHYFKHNNISSFIRQLNMYGFRKVGAIEQGALKVEKDDVEFQHPYFQRGEDKLLEFIKRRTSNTKNDSLKYIHDDVNELLVDVHSIKGKQENVTNKLDQLRSENEVLWREVANLRQKHSKQQQIVNKLIQFLVTLAGGNRGLSGMKRKMQLMIEEPGNQSQPANKMPKLNRPLSITENEDNYTVQSPGMDMLASPAESTGPIIHDVTDVYHYNSSPMLPETTDTTQQTQYVGIHTPNTIQPNTTQPHFVQTTQAQSPQSAEDKSDQLVMSTNFNDMINMVSPSQVTNTDQILPSSGNDAAQKQPNSEKSVAVCPSTSTLTSSSPTECPKHVVNEQLDLMQKDLDGLKEFLASGQFINMDSNTLLGLFTPESPLPNCDALFDEDFNTTPIINTTNTNSSTDPAGNELMHFNPNDGVPLNLFDLTDEEGDLDRNLVDNLGGTFQNDGQLHTPGALEQETNPLAEGISSKDLD
ncbi:hypothetical protein SNE40_012842 [Patella caerulea]|uniref:HSF-type DNA-binding domain-containing protein n=1 Tax=Patella caerulea TaxID=87958 RepID=A0AAN8JMC4_PATCE